MKKKRENEKFEEGCAQEESQVKQSSEREASCEKNSMENGEPQECGAEGNAVEEQAGRLDADLEALGACGDERSFATHDGGIR